MHPLHMLLIYISCIYTWDSLTLKPFPYLKEIHVA